MLGCEKPLSLRWLLFTVALTCATIVALQPHYVSPQQRIAATLAVLLCVPMVLLRWPVFPTLGGPIIEKLHVVSTWLAWITFACGFCVIRVLVPGAGGGEGGFFLIVVISFLLYGGAIAAGLSWCGAIVVFLKARQNGSMVLYFPVAVVGLVVVLHWIGGLK